MLDLKGHLAPSTIDAPVPKLREQIRAKLPSQQLAALIGEPFYRRMLKELGVELHTFHLDATDWGPSVVALGPGEPIANSRAQGRWEPWLCSPAVAEPCWPVPQVGGSAPTPIACSLLQPLMHLLASMREAS